MNTQIVADGRRMIRYRESRTVGLRELRKSIHARYATELASAGTLRKVVVLWRMGVEYRKERARLEPSPHALFANGRCKKAWN